MNVANVGSINPNKDEEVESPIIDLRTATIEEIFREMEMRFTSVVLLVDAFNKDNNRQEFYQMWSNPMAAKTMVNISDKYLKEVYRTENFFDE